MKTKILTTIIRTLIIISLFFFSCGALHKKQSLEQSKQNIENLNLQSQDSQISREASQWFQSLIEQLHFNNTLIHSDSTIIYQPNGGFQLSKGTIILSEVNQQTTTSQKNTSSQEQGSSYSHQQQELKVNQEQINKQHEKERSPPLPLKWLLFLSIIALLAPLFLAYKRKRNKR